MASSFSYAQVGGNLGKDPESRATPNGAKVTSFSLAVEKGFGERQSTSWFNIIAFGPQAEFAEKYLKKGKAVRVSGDLQIRSWDDKTTGAKKYITEIVAYKIDFAGDDKPASDRPTRQERATPAPRQQAVPETRQQAAYSGSDFSSDPNDDDSIPF